MVVRNRCDWVGLMWLGYVNGGGSVMTCYAKTESLRECEGELEYQLWRDEGLMWKKNGVEVWYIYLIFSDDLILSLLYAFSDEVRFIENNKTNGHHFPISDDLFLSLIAWPVAPFSNESVRCKKLKLFATKKLTAVDQFGFLPPLLFGALNLAHPIVTKSKFHR